MAEQPTLRIAPVRDDVETADSAEIADHSNSMLQEIKALIAEAEHQIGQPRNKHKPKLGVAAFMEDRQLDALVRDLKALAAEIEEAQENDNPAVVAMPDVAGQMKKAG